VIKFITVRVDEEQKRLDKVKKIRESRQRVRGTQAAAAAAQQQQQAEAQAVSKNQTLQ
jgi:small subunit ribosomal protein S6